MMVMGVHSSCKTIQKRQVLIARVHKEGRVWLLGAALS
jgi:hypothetical protein